MARDGTAPVDLGIDSFAGSAVHDQQAFRIYGPFPVPTRKVGNRATPPAIVSGPGWPLGKQFQVFLFSIVPAKVRDTLA